MPTARHHPGDKTTRRLTRALIRAGMQYAENDEVDMRSKIEELKTGSIPVPEHARAYISVPQ